MPAMTTYDIHRGTEYHGCVCVQDDRQKVWTFTSEWQEFWLTAEKQKETKMRSTMPRPRR